MDDQVVDVNKHKGQRTIRFKPMVHGGIGSLTKPKLPTQRVGELKLPTQRSNPQAIHGFVQLREKRLVLFIIHADTRIHSILCTGACINATLRQKSSTSHSMDRQDSMQSFGGAPHCHFGSVKTCQCCLQPECNSKLH